MFRSVHFLNFFKPQMVHFFVFFNLLSSSRSFRSSSPSSESWDRGKVTPISKAIFFSVLISELLFLCFDVFVFSIATNKTHSKNKSNRTKKKEDITLQNLAGGKYIYGPLNARKKDVKCATTPSKWILLLNRYHIQFTGNQQALNLWVMGRIF